MAVREVNFDGIVGPTHNYAGLSFGNLASTLHEKKVSSPRRAALQGLEKMKFVSELGVPQGVLPPLRRPHIGFLKQLGFRGSVAEIIQFVGETDPRLLAASYSSSNMWTANAATVSPSSDCADGRLHLTPANLASGLHRSIETSDTLAVLRAIFHDSTKFAVHDPLPCNFAMSDEGAANHTRLCDGYGSPGIEVFVFGRSELDKSCPAPVRFPARQTLEASRAIARVHQLKPQSTFFIQQNPAAIDAGVFHNDVVSVGNGNFLMYHETAFLGGELAVADLCQSIGRLQGWELSSMGFSEQDLPLKEAVSSYLFNSQLISRESGDMTLVCPLEVKQVQNAFRCTQRILDADNPVTAVEFLDLRQSMNNGGGPACLRLRVVMTEEELASVHPGVLFSDTLYARLRDWVNRNYRDELSPDDLHDPVLVGEVDTAFNELQAILELPPSVFRMGI